MSTPALLENAIAQKEILGKSFLLADTTYKLIIKDSILLSPVITQDIDHPDQLPFFHRGHRGLPIRIWNYQGNFRFDCVKSHRERR